MTRQWFEKFPGLQRAWSVIYCVVCVAFANYLRYYVSKTSGKERETWLLWSTAVAMAALVSKMAVVAIKTNVSQASRAHYTSHSRGAVIVYGHAIFISWRGSRCCRCCRGWCEQGSEAEKNNFEMHGSGRGVDFLRPGWRECEIWCYSE